MSRPSTWEEMLEAHRDAWRALGRELLDVLGVRRLLKWLSGWE